VIDIDNLMKEVTDKYNIELKHGDYKYAAWYSQEAYEKDEWKGYWFAHKSEQPTTLYIPTSYSYTDKISSFFHEVGHIKDYLNGVKFDTTWDNEVSAWNNSFDFVFNEFKIDIDVESFKKHAIEGLSTYQKSQNKTDKDTLDAINNIIKNKVTIKDRINLIIKKVEDEDKPKSKTKIKHPR
jgi:hypothetical protein